MSFFGSIYADPDLPHRARAVYMYLRDRAGGGSCWPGVKTIARGLHLSPRTLQTLRDRRQIPFTVLGNRLLLYPESGIRAVLDRNLRPAAGEFPR